ncbi:MAG: Mur ligase domain-containing protein [Phycisphaerales bacterium]|jgi:UDP-N-acetylmuramate--alanine ligase|nr:Mur ligase domain-containing protein [Phycisphaerales bacterium]
MKRFSTPPAGGAAFHDAALRFAAHAAEAPLELSGTHVHMVGIGGCGMSGLARVLCARGAIVSGSDMQASETTDDLAAEGVAVSFDQQSGVIPQDAAMVIMSAAIRPDHPEALEAARRDIPTLTYAEALGKCMLGHTGVAIAGTHGKSTTTAMLGAALTDAGLDPSVVVGATCAQLARGSLATPIDARPGGHRVGADRIPTGSLAGQPGLLVAEACEFNRSFHNFRPRIASISSVEADHLDIYGSLDAVVEAFHEFARLLPPAKEGGRLLIAHDGAHRREVTRGLECAVETIGTSPEADWVVTYDPTSRRVTLEHEGAIVASWLARLPGHHNATNAATACALGVMLGADPELLAQSLAAFRGVDRRCQFLGERAVGPLANAASGDSQPDPRHVVRVYDDYGHHPTEIDATLRALRDFERPEERGGRLVVVFQPHQHSRTRFLLEEFATAFSQADVVIVPHIYFVRDSEQEKHKVSASDLVDRLRKRGVQAMHLYPFDAIVEQLEVACRPGDTLVVMGAGPVWQVGRGFLKRASEAHTSRERKYA